MYLCEEANESTAADQYQSSCTPEDIGLTGSGNMSTERESGTAVFQDDFDGYGGERKAGYFESRDGANTMVREGGVAKGDNGHLELGVATGAAGYEVTDSTAGAGAQLNLFEGAIRSEEVNDAEDQGESQVRIGGSVGVGAAGRAHYGDADGDGVNEYGFGFDAGPLSFDIKSEYLDIAHQGDRLADWWESF